MIMRMVVVLMIVAMRRHRRADRSGTVQRLQKRHKRAALHPQQSHPDEDDQRVAHDFDHVDRAAHGRRSRAQQRRRYPDDHDRDQRLQQRRRERQDHPARPGFIIGDDVGRDHRLAVPRAGGMKNTVQERQPEKGPGGAAVGLGGADQARELAVEFGLLGEDPTQHAPDGRGRHLRTRRTKRAGLRECAIDQACDEQKAGNDADEQSDMAGRQPPTRGFQGHFTVILFANSVPMVSEGSR